MKNSLLIFLFCCSGFMYGQGTWTRLLDQPVYGLAINPKNPNMMIAGGLGRTLYRSYDAGRTWQIDSIEFRSGSSQLTNVLISSIDTNVVLIGGVFNSIRRSTNQGRDWETVFETEKPQFLTPGETIIEKPDEPQLIYAGDNASNRIFRSKDIGKSWDTLGTLNVPALCTIAFRHDSTNIMYAGCKTGIIERSTDAGATWKRVTILRAFQDAEIPKIIFSKKDPLLGFAIIAYFLPNNKPNGGVFKTTDGGYSWKEHYWRDTSFWAICFAEKPQQDLIFLGGFSDANDVIPGPGSIMKSDLSSSVRMEFDAEIPWFINQGGIMPRRNVWMLRSVNFSNDMLVYAATEAGFYRYTESTVQVEEKEQVQEYFINGLTLRSRSAINTTMNISSIDGRILKTGIGEVLFHDLSDGVYLVSNSVKQSLPILLLKMSNQLNLLIGS